MFKFKIKLNMQMLIAVNHYYDYQHLQQVCSVTCFVSPCFFSSLFSFCLTSVLLPPTDSHLPLTHSHLIPLFLSRLQALSISSILAGDCGRALFAMR